MSLAVCIVDEGSLFVEARSALAELGIRVDMLIENEARSYTAVRGRTITELYLYGLLEHQIEEKLASAVKAACMTNKTKAIEIQ
jgi:hypothetical protein